MGPEKLHVFFEPVNGSPGAIAQLRRFVLNLAMSGKLDDQVVDDKYVHSVLIRSQAESHIRFSETKTRLFESKSAIGADEVPLPVTSVANFVRLGDVAVLMIGQTGIQASKPGDYPLVVTAQNRASCDHFDFDGAAAIIPLVSSTGHGDASLKRIHYQEGKFALGSILCAVFPFLPEVVTARFLFEYLDAFKEELLVSRMIGTANVSLTTAKIAEVPVPIVSIHAQRKLGELMQLCDALEARGRLVGEQHARLTSTLFDALAASESAHGLAENWEGIAEHFDLLLDRPEAIDAVEQTILQLAIRGLLVPQDANDEPASELLKNLRAEKNRMIEANEIRREKILPHLTTEDEPFVLPNGWVWSRLGSLANFIDYRGKTPTKTSSGVPLITAKNVRQGFINRIPREFIVETDYKGWMTRGFPKIGDLLFTTEAPLGNVAAIDIAERFALAQRVICFSLYEPRMSGCLKFFIMSSWLQSEFSSRATGVTAQGIKSARLQLVPIPVPPLAEQQRIVARVEELRHLCAQLRERLTAAKRTQSQLAEALVNAVATKPKSATDTPSQIAPHLVRAARNCYAINAMADEPSFGRTQLTKVDYLLANHIPAPYQTQHTRMPAGPHDEWISIFEKEGERNGWFTISESITANGNKMMRYTTKPGILDMAAAGAKELGDKRIELERVLTLLKGKKTEEVEMIATLYAVWNDALIAGQPCSDDALINDFFNWHEKKRRFDAKDLKSKLAWMRKNGLVPSGNGASTSGQNKLFSD